MSRSTELRNRERRVFRVSLGIAVVVHVVALGLVAWASSVPEWRPDHDTVVLEPEYWTGTRVDVFFGPPKIFQVDGTIAPEPPDRVLAAVRVLQMPPLCLAREIPPGAPGSGEVRLIVNAEGRIDSVRLERSTGDACWDRVAMRVAGDLWYRWLPSARFAAPVELLQPMTVALADR